MDNDPFFAGTADPFFASSGDVAVAPVRATRALDRNDDDDDGYGQRGRWRDDKKRKTRDFDQHRGGSEKIHTQMTSKPAAPSVKPKPYCENKRMPSMLNDVPSPKPLKIYANKPPNSKKFFNVEMPEQWKYPEPYD